ncbi:MAG: hypothetical protein LH480_05315 [Rubrivivax sp.]|nr:hypothetical protein [Rubrivivax sp.]
MDWAYKAMLTAATVAAVMMATRLFDRRWAGLLAGQPVITAPALLWLAQDQGATFAAGSAWGAVAACAVAPLYAAVFVALAWRLGAVRAVACAALGAVAATAVLQPWQSHAMLTLLAALLVCGAVLLRTPSGLGSGSVRPLAGEPWLSAGLAGVVTALVSLAAASASPFWVGVLASLPLISGFALVHLHRAGAQEHLHRFLRGYVQGIVGKAFFASTFAYCVSRWGVLPAFGAAVAAGLAVTALLSWRGGLAAAEPAARAVPRGGD